MDERQDSGVGPEPAPLIPDELRVEVDRPAGMARRSARRIGAGPCGRESKRWIGPPPSAMSRRSSSRVLRLRSSDAIPFFSCWGAIDATSERNVAMTSSTVRKVDTMMRGYSLGESLPAVGIWHAKRTRASGVAAISENTV